MTLTSGRGKKKTSSQLSLHPLRFCAGTGTAASGFNQSEKLQVTGRELPLSAGGANVCEVGAGSGVEARRKRRRQGMWRGRVENERKGSRIPFHPVDRARAG